VEPDLQGVRDTGREAVRGFKRSIAQRVIDLLDQRDPALVSSLVEVGIVNRDFRDAGEGPLLTDTPTIDVVERLLERSVERRPSLLSRLGLSTIQALASSTEDGSTEGGLASSLVVVFTDLEGFTRFTQQQGDEAASELLVRHHRTVGPIVRSRGGRTVKRLGDGLLLTFPEPEAAVLCCLEMVEAEPSPLRLRAGIHLGDVLVTRDDVIGHVVNVAARVCESARGAEVLATTDVRAGVAGSIPRVEFGRARRRGFKGVDEPVNVCAVRRP
jgi:adenylate cyclase